MTGAILTGLRVLDLTDHRGVLTGRMLAMMGADVLQIEPADGTQARAQAPFDDAGASLFWQVYGRGRRSLVLDRKAEEARLMALVAVADVVLESGIPGEGRFLDTDRLLQANDRIIHAIVTPFGLEGPKAAYADSDLVIWAAGGPLKPTESQAGVPTRISLPQAYHHAAADALCGIMVALEARRSAGTGQRVVTSAQASATQCTLSLSMAAVIGHPNYVFRAEVTSKKKRELDLSGSGSRTQRSKWPVKDGLVEMHLAMGPAAGRFTNALFAVMAGQGACSPAFAQWDWVTLPPRIENDEISEDDLEQARSEVAAFLAGLTKQEAVALALRHRLMLAPIMTPADLVNSPHAQARGFMERQGRLSLPGKLALGFDAGFVTPDPAPQIGQGGVETEAAWLGAPDAARPYAAAARTQPNDRPLSHLTVLDLSWVVAGPMIGRCMADFGAQVIRVESAQKPEVARLTGPYPEGVRDVNKSGLYENCNAGKQGLSIDLSQEAGRRLIRDLAGQVDVVVESFAPGQMDKWGLGYDMLSQNNPGLVMVSTSLMGQSGAWSSLAGFGNIGAAMSGLQVLAGRDPAAPTGPYGPYTDFVAPKLAFPVVMAALEAKRQTGQGRHLDISQAEAGMQFIAEAFAVYADSGLSLAAVGNRDPLIVPNEVYPCKASDGETAWVAISVTSDAAWLALCSETGVQALADPALRDLQGRQAQEAMIDAALAAWCRDQTPQAVETRLQARGVAAHVVASPDDLARDAQLAAWGHFQSLPRTDGTPAYHESCRFALSRTPAQTLRAAPDYGRDTRAVLSGLLGLDPAQIAQLEQDGVLT